MERKFNNIRLKELRQEKHLSQRELAMVLDIHQANLSRWEAGAIIPNVMDCWALADFFNVTIDYLVGKDNY